MAKKQSKQSKAAEVLAKIAAAQGMATGSEGSFSLRASLEKLRNTDHGASSREAESVLRSLHKPHEYMMRKCKNKKCGEPFQTNYCSTAYCSDTCLAEDLKAIGIDYDPYQKKRWEHSMYASNSGLMYRYEPPEYISTETLNQLEPVFRQFLADLDRLRGVAQEVETRQNQENLATAQADWDSLFEPESFAPEDSQLNPEPHVESPKEEDYGAQAILDLEPLVLVDFPDFS